MYPPPCALFLPGASLLGQGGLILLLVAINSAAWFYSARLSAILAGGMAGARNVWLYVIPNLLVIVYIWSSYHLGQPNLVLLALMLGAFFALRANREIVTSSLIAVDNIAVRAQRKKSAKHQRDRKSTRLNSSQVEK